MYTQNNSEKIKQYIYNIKNGLHTPQVVLM